MQDLVVVPGVVIPGSELSRTAVRASGPGGQNVNKVASKVELSFDFTRSSALSQAAKRRLRALAQNRLDSEGRLVIVSQLSRNQSQNVEDARRKLAALVARALVPPKPRIKSAPSRAARERRLAQKRKNSQKKGERRQRSDE